MSELWEQERIDWGVIAKSLDSLYSTKQFFETKNMSLIWILDFQSYPASEFEAQMSFDTSLILICM